MQITGTPAFKATAVPPLVASGLRVPLALCAVAGFSGLLAEQGFEKYLQLLVGTTATAWASLLFIYFLGFALGSVAVASLIRRGRIGRPLLAYGTVQLALGIGCVLLSYCCHSLLAPLAGLGCLAMLPAAALMGAAFPLIAHALDSAQSRGRKRWAQAYAASLAGALLASLAAPLFIMPLMGLRGAMWICLALGVAVCVVTTILPDGRHTIAQSAPARAPIDPIFRLLLAGSFGARAVFLALQVIWTHLAGVALGSSVYASAWTLAAVLLGLLTGALLADRPIGWSSLFQLAALLLTLQLVLWDHVPGLFRLAALQNSFYFAEFFRLCLAILLLAPPAAAVGLIYPRLLASPYFDAEHNSHLAGYLSAANALGCLCGMLLGVFVLVPLAGAEVSLKAVALALALCWILFLLREPHRPKRLAVTAASAAVLLIVLLGRWWNWGTLVAGFDNHFGQAQAHNNASATGIRYLPASFVFKREDLQGGFTTVAEQTVVTGEVAHTVRALFTNGDFRGDDNLPWAETQAQFGFPAISSQFVADYGSALLIGLGTGQSAASLKHLGYREVSVAEIAPGIVKAAEESFSVLNEGILGDPRVKLYLEDGRHILLTAGQNQYDLIGVELPGIGHASASDLYALYAREFYELAHSRLRPGGVFQQWVQLDRMSAREIASQLATARSVFPYVGLWYYGGRGILVAADHPLNSPKLQAGMAPDEAAKLLDLLSDARLLDSDGVARLVAGEHPPIDTDNNLWIEYAAPRYVSSSGDGVARNLEFLRRYR